MNFTYKIENYIPSEKRLFVIYSPANTDLLPHGGWVGLDDGMSEQEIHNRVVECVPLVKWERVADPSVEALVGSVSNTVSYTPPVDNPSTPSLDSIVRNIRNDKLTRSDWTQSPDSPLTAEQKQAWAVYRQALRDITDSESFPDSVTWPTAP